MASSVPILMYHAVHPKSSVISIKPELFQWQMGWLFENQYKVISLGSIVEDLVNGDPLPDRAVALTFDDGYACLFDYALPVVENYGFSATVFLVVNHCGGMNNWAGQPKSIPSMPMLNWEQISEMDRRGVQFGAHTMNHPRLDQVQPEEIEWEIKGSKTILEEKLGHPVMSFAYPYGQKSSSVCELVEREFRVACGTQLGMVTSSSDPYELERIEMFYLQNPRLFRGLSLGWFSSYLSVRRAGRFIASTMFRRE